MRRLSFSWYPFFKVPVLCTCTKGRGQTPPSIYSRLLFYLAVKNFVIDFTTLQNSCSDNQSTCESNQSINQSNNLSLKSTLLEKSGNPSAEEDDQRIMKLYSRLDSRDPHPHPRPRRCPCPCPSGTFHELQPVGFHGRRYPRSTASPLCTLVCSDLVFVPSRKQGHASKHRAPRQHCVAV